MSVEALILLMVAFGFACDRFARVLREMRRNKAAGVTLPSGRALRSLWDRKSAWPRRRLPPG